MEWEDVSRKREGREGHIHKIFLEGGYQKNSLEKGPSRPSHLDWTFPRTRSGLLKGLP
jgi:hypothetical protein